MPAKQAGILLVVLAGGLSAAGCDSGNGAEAEPRESVLEYAWTTGGEDQDGKTLGFVEVRLYRDGEMVDSHRSGLGETSLPEVEEISLGPELGQALLITGQFHADRSKSQIIRAGDDGKLAVVFESFHTQPLKIEDVNDDDICEISRRDGQGGGAFYEFRDGKYTITEME
ncbi:MAG: hypothetical protein ACLFUJ_06730 [Phycisphaerae bacterium]